MAKVIIYLRDHEFTALNDLAQRGYRALRVQAGMIPDGQPVPSHQTDLLSEIQDEPVVEGG